MHVGIESADEGVAVIDRIRSVAAGDLGAVGELAVLARGRQRVCELSVPGLDRLPTAGPTDAFGSAAGYHAEVDRLLRTEVVLDLGMIYFDARLSHHLPTVEIRIADVCLHRDDSLLVAALTRALVETAVRDWRAGRRRPPVGDLRCSRLAGLASGAIGAGRGSDRPARGRRCRPGEVLADLLQHVGEALADQGDHELVADLLEGLLARGTGAVHQRRWARQKEDLGAMVLRLADLTDTLSPRMR